MVYEHRHARKINAYCIHLCAEERSAGTIAKYRRDLTALAVFLNGEALTAESAAAWKTHLLQTHTPRTVNAMLAAVNGFCRSHESVRAFLLAQQVSHNKQRKIFVKTAC